MTPSQGGPICDSRPTMPNRSNPSQEDLNYIKTTRMHGKNAKRHSEAADAISTDADRWTGGLIFRARFHRGRSWETITVPALDESARNAVQGVVEQVMPVRGGEYWYVHNDGASSPPMDFEDVMEWIEENSVLAGGREQVMDVVVYDRDPREGRDADRFVFESRKKREGSKGEKFNRWVKKCVVQ